VKLFQRTPQPPTTEHTLDAPLIGKGYPRVKCMRFTFTAQLTTDELADVAGWVRRNNSHRRNLTTLPVFREIVQAYEPSLLKPNYNGAGKTAVFILLAVFAVIARRQHHPAPANTPTDILNALLPSPTDFAAACLQAKCGFEVFAVVEEENDDAEDAN